MFGSSNCMSVPVVTGLNGGDGMMGGNGGWWVLIILLALFGGFRGGWGNNGGGSSEGADIQRGFDTQTIERRLDSVNNGICSLGYDQLSRMNTLGTDILQTGYNVTTAVNNASTAAMQQFNALSMALQNCCCENRAAIAQVRYDMANNTATLGNEIQQVKQTIIDQFCQLKLEQKDQKIADQAALINSLNLAQSQANQNQFFQAALNAAVAQLAPKTPVPAFMVPNPNAAYYGQCQTGWNFGGQYTC